jgi:hypothetical protein
LHSQKNVVATQAADHESSELPDAVRCVNGSRLFRVNAIACER